MGFFSDAQGQPTLWSMVGSGRISNSSKLLCLSSLRVSIKRIQSRTTEKKWQHGFSNYITICCHGIQWSDLAEFQTHPNFFLHVLIACKYEKDQINQRTNGPVNAHLISWSSKAQNIQNLGKICGKEMTLTFNTHIHS